MAKVFGTTALYKARFKTEYSPVGVIDQEDQDRKQKF
jgi:hypothetical protein